MKPLAVDRNIFAAVRIAARREELFRHYLDLLRVRTHRWFGPVDVSAASLRKSPNAVKQDQARPRFSRP